MSRWEEAASLADCPPGSSLEVVVAGRMIALYNIEGTIHALDGVCPHQGGPLGKGELEGKIVTCPWHGWQFNIETGQHQINPSLTQPCIPIRVEDDVIFVGLEAER
ncbi:MAG: Rieske (2Fe-2S) protein [Planctomycetales bacterium]